MKQGVRIAAFASGPIKGRGRKGKLILVGVIWRNNTMEGVVSNRIVQDGKDSTNAIINSINKSRFKPQVKAIALNGVALAGLNIVDIRKLKKMLGTEILIVTRRRQRPAELIKAIRLYGGAVKSKQLMIKLVNEQAKLKLNAKSGFYFRASIENTPKTIIEEAVAALRTAHLIARGISTGESKGRI